MQVKFNDYRWRFSHPDIPIDEDILREVLSAGDQASIALRAAHNSEIVGQFSSPHPKAMDAAAMFAPTGRMADLIRRRDALRDQLGRIDASGPYRGQGNERETTAGALSEVGEAISAEKARQADAEVPLRAAVEEARRCARYALEAGCKIPELAAWRNEVDWQ